MNKLISTKKSSLYFIGWPFRNWKVAVDLKLVENWNISTKIWQFLLFCINIANLFTMLCKTKLKKLEFVQGVNFELIDSLKINGTKYMLIFADSCDKICNSKPFVDVATAGRHRGLSTI